MTNRPLVPVSAEEDVEWRALVEKIADEVGDLPDNVVAATEYLLAGWPTYRIAKELHCKAADIKGWLKQYPTMAKVVAESRQRIIQWRLARLEQQFVKAIQKSDEVLSLDLVDKDVNTKLVGMIAQHARYIIGLYAGQKIDVNIHLPDQDQTLKAKQDALDYIVNRLAEQRGSEEPIETTYRVIDAKAANNRPLLQPDGSSPFGQIGVLEEDTQVGFLCHICGKHTPLLRAHVHTAHHMKAGEYETLFLFEPGSLHRAETARTQTRNEHAEPNRTGSGGA